MKVTKDVTTREQAVIADRAAAANRETYKGSMETIQRLGAMWAVMKAARRILGPQATPEEADRVATDLIETCESGKDNALLDSATQQDCRDEIPRLKAVRKALRVLLEGC